MQSKSILRITLFAALAALALAACAPKSYEEKVSKLRKNYTARLIGFIVLAQPEPESLVAEGIDGDADADFGEAAAEAMSDDLGEGAEPVEPVEEVPIRQNIAVDILLQHDSPEKLPGITLDIEMVDANQQTKNVWRTWVDTASLPKATGTQFTHKLEDIDYVEGDGFNVEVRSFVPPEERSEYREFTEPSGG